MNEHNLDVRPAISEQGKYSWLDIAESGFQKLPVCSF